VPGRAWLLAGIGLTLAGCRVETVAPGSGGSQCEAPAAPTGEVWVYTSMYRPVLDAIDPLLQRTLPGISVHWYQAGSEKVANRLDAELAAGGTQADLLLTSDPFLYERLKRDGLLMRYVSPNAQRTPRSLVDLEGHYTTSRLSTMVIAYRSDLAEHPESFRALTDPAWRGEVALGDPLTSGTAFTWALSLSRSYGTDYFGRLRQNGAVVAGGNAAVQQKLESGEAKVGVLLLENVLTARAKGSPLAFVYPTDGAVVVPGPLALFQSSRHPAAAKAVYDFLLSVPAQELMVDTGQLHAADPRVRGPGGEPGLEALLARARGWDAETVEAGVSHGAEVKDAFARAFQK